MANRKPKNRGGDGTFAVKFPVTHDGKKQCSICHEFKELDNFSFVNKTKQLRSARCKNCFNYLRRTKWRKAPEQQKKEKDYRERTKEIQSLRVKNWKKHNKEHYNETIRRRARERRNSDVSFRVRSNLSRRVNHALSKFINEEKLVKSISTLNLLGCDIPYLSIHLEKQFSQNMSWSNYGEWEIDHIIPCDYFNLSNEEEQKICFHYLNLQPLWKNENRSKSNIVNKKKITTKLVEINDALNFTEKDST